MWIAAGLAQLLVEEFAPLPTAIGLCVIATVTITTTYAKILLLETVATVDLHYLIIVKA